MSEQDLSELVDAPWEVMDTLEDFLEVGDEEDNSEIEEDISEPWHPKKRFNMDDKINEQIRRPGSKCEKTIKIVDKQDRVAGGVLGSTPATLRNNKRSKG